MKKTKLFCIVSLILPLMYGTSPVEKQLIKTTDKVVELKQELNKAQYELLKQKKVDRVVKYYKQAGTFEKWGLSREYIMDWFDYSEKWKFLSGGGESFDMVDLMVGIIHNETNGINKEAKEKNGTYSWGITHINDACITRIEKELNEQYPEFKGRSIKYDVEKNIAGRFLWIKHRKESKLSWALMGPKTGWYLYWILSTIK